MLHKIVVVGQKYDMEPDLRSNRLAMIIEGLGKDYELFLLLSENL